jgi:hypothetical protein
MVAIPATDREFGWTEIEQIRYNSVSWAIEIGSNYDTHGKRLRLPQCQFLYVMHEEK